MSDLDVELGTENDPVSDGTRLDHDETAVAAEDPDREESQTEPEEEAEAPDLDAPMFAFTDEDGNERELTGNEIIAALATGERQGTLEEELQAIKTQLDAQQQAQATTPQQPQQEDEGAAPIDYRGTGDVLDRMLQGDEDVGGVEAIGPALAEFVNRHAAHSQELHQVVTNIVEQYMGAQRTRESFSKDFGDLVEARQDGSLTNWRSQHPDLAGATDTEAYLAMTVQNLRQQLDGDKESNKTALGEAEAKGKKAGSDETVKNLRAKGVLRPLAGGGQVKQPAAGDLSQKYDLNDPDQRVRAWTEKILSGRQ